MFSIVVLYPSQQFCLARIENSSLSEPPTVFQRGPAQQFWLDCQRKIALNREAASNNDACTNDTSLDAPSTNDPTMDNACDLGNDNTKDDDGWISDTGEGISYANVDMSCTSVDGDLSSHTFSDQTEDGDLDSSHWYSDLREDSVLDSNQAEDIDYYSGQAEKRYTAEEMCCRFGNLSFGDSN